MGFSKLSGRRLLMQFMRNYQSDLNKYNHCIYDVVTSEQMTLKINARVLKLNKASAVWGCINFTAPRNKTKTLLLYTHAWEESVASFTKII